MKSANFTIDDLENHEKEDNYTFYASHLGKEILNHHNYPPDIREYLKCEHQTIHKLLSQNNGEQYDALLEIGCANARNLELASTLNLNYFGIDFIEKEIRLAEQKIKEQNITAVVKCMSFMHLTQKNTPVPLHARTICLLPFNLLGNIFDPVKAFKIMRNLGYDMLVSTYRDDVLTDSITQYYHTCGLLNIQRTELRNGILFTSLNGFHSIIYKSHYLKRIATILNFNLSITDFSNIGKLYYFTKLQ